MVKLIKVIISYTKLKNDLRDTNFNFIDLFCLLFNLA
jgi:hypothetical protein